jgi:2-polyprenyl-3-methyl-5-hydroxy-6-metoxy-1,4-benzoquinol methylase
MNTEKRDFDKEAASWDENPTRVKLADDIAQSILKLGILTPKMNVLDFGCGTGLLSVSLHPFVRSITGADSSQGMLDILNSKIAKMKLANIRTQLVDVEKGDVLTGNYDFIVCSMTLHHVNEIEPLIDQFVKITKPGGYLCISDLDPDDGQFHSDNAGVFHFGFDAAFLTNLFIKTGYENMQRVTAAEMVKPAKDGQLRRFSIFLMTGRKK